RRGGNRLAVDAERRMKRRSDVVLKDEPALSCELIAQQGAGRRVGVKGARVALDLAPRPARHGILVTLLAPVRIEQRPQARLRSENAVEHDAAAVKLRPLRSGQAAG